MFRFAQRDIMPKSERVIPSEAKLQRSPENFRGEARLSISDHIFCCPRPLIQLWLLFPVVTQVEPPWISSFNQRNFSAATPTLQPLLTGDRVVHVAEMFNPNESGQMIAPRKAIHFTISMLVQAAHNLVRYSDIQRRAVFIRKKVNPIIVVTHASRMKSEMFRFAQHDNKITSQLSF
jgi:hypothetical protein